MKILHKKDALHVDEPKGTRVDYYLRDEYELHYNKQVPHTTQTWHHHDHILETLFIIDGELLVQWKEQGVHHEEIVRTGDLIETENTPHTFTNQSDKYVTFIVLKQVLSGSNKKELLKTDKVIDHE